MKNFLVILALLFVFSSVPGQTYEELKEKNKETQAELQKRLDKINSRIFYLEDEVLQISTDKKGLIYDNRQVKKDQKLRSEELILLKKQKANITAALEKLDTDYYSVIQKETNPNVSNLPVRMSKREYKGRSRTQAFETVDNTVAIMNANKQLKGKLINNKRGRGETAYFYFERLDIKEAISRPAESVDPNSETNIYLPMGEYLCTVKCGSFCKSGIVRADPRSTTTIGKNKETVHFWAVKELSDY